MNTPTYKEQFDKLTIAYIKNEVDPWNGCACFVGNLLNGERLWTNGRLSATIDLEMGQECILDRDYLVITNGAIIKEAGGLYTAKEVFKLEGLFLSTIWRITDGQRKQADNYEDALFAAFEATLDLLKQIHISKGEVIDETPKFSKRELPKKAKP